MRSPPLASPDIPQMRLFRAVALALSGSSLIAAAPEAETSRALAALQADDAHLQSIGWRLVTGNAPFCGDSVPAVGLLLQDMRNYDSPAPVRQAAGITGDIAVQATAAGSPAELADLRPNDEVLAINEEEMAALPAVPSGDYRRLKALHDRIDGALVRDGKVGLTIRRADTPVREVTLAGQRACPGRFELKTAGRSAQADGDRVIMGRGFASTGRPSDRLEEAERAFVVAHELAHNLLGHRSDLDRTGRQLGKIRLTEREADRLGVWLLANAGYDPEAASRLMRGWGRRNDPGLFRLPTHDGWDERADLIDAEVVRVRAALAATGRADWSRYFSRDRAR